MTDSTLKAQKMALQNASEFIRGHGEEGGIEDDSFDGFTVEQYLAACNRVAKMLDTKATNVKFKSRKN